MRQAGPCWERLSLARAPGLLARSACLTRGVGSDGEGREREVGEREVGEEEVGEREVGEREVGDRKLRRQILPT